MATKTTTVKSKTPKELSGGDVKAIEDLRVSYEDITSEVGKIIIGQEAVIERMLTCMLSRGHALLMGVPGLAKTLLVNSLAQTTSLSFGRIQFTPDLMPSDVTGTEILQSTGEGLEREFVFAKGPLFANVILADEINRTPPKTQSALLEAMQEKRVTVAGKHHTLPEPFFVLATQNPIEQEGTYPLPEAQVDRFMMKVVVDYPTRDEEREILKRMATTTQSNDVSSVMESTSIAEARTLVDQIYLDDQIANYIVDLVQTSRTPEKVSIELSEFVENGASPRATLSLTLCAKANAFLDGRGYVTPQDVKDMAYDVLRHRIATTYEAEAEGITSDDIITAILKYIPVP